MLSLDEVGLWLEVIFVYLEEEIIKVDLLLVEEKVVVEKVRLMILVEFEEIIVNFKY